MNQFWDICQEARRGLIWRQHLTNILTSLRMFLLSLVERNIELTKFTTNQWYIFFKSQCENSRILLLKKISFFQPHNHGKKVAKFYYATPELVNKAIDTSLQAKKEWEKIPLDDRLQFFLKIADLMAGKYRAELNATTMLGQAKTVIQVQCPKHNVEISGLFCHSDFP